MTLQEFLFQSTRPRGARPTSGRCSAHGIEFQSTRPRGARLDVAVIRGERLSFNPRAREGRDSRGTRKRGLRGVSIHAPARGATTRQNLFLCVFLFQSTRPRGARPALPYFRMTLFCFNPRAREGRDLDYSFSQARFDSFQSTRPRGARHSEFLDSRRLKRFNPRAREGRDLPEMGMACVVLRFNPRAR